MSSSFNIFKIEDIKKHRLSDWFSKKQVIRDEKFRYTQPADTNMPFSLCYCESLKYVNKIDGNSSITCVVTSKEFAKIFKRTIGIVVTDTPRLDFFRLHNKLAQKVFRRPPFKPEIDLTVQIHQNAVIGKYCHLGKNAVIHPGAIVLNNSYIGDGVVIGPNVVVGSEGLEFKRNKNKLFKVLHIGGVYIKDNVEIMANSVVCKDVYFGYTHIDDGTKIGPLCDIAHRSSVGRNCTIAGNTTIGGSARIGNDVRIGPSATISDGICVGDNATVSLGSVVVKDVQPNQTVSGFFAIDHVKALKEFASHKSKGN